MTLTLTYFKVKVVAGRGPQFSEFACIVTFVKAFINLYVKMFANMIVVLYCKSCSLQMFLIEIVLVCWDIVIRLLVQYE